MKKARICITLLLVALMTVALIACSNSESPKEAKQQETNQKTEAPKAEAPKAEAPKAEAPKAEAPKAEAPKAEAPKAEAPKAEAPKAEAPKAEAPKADGKVIIDVNFDDGKTPKNFRTEVEGTKSTGNVTVEDKALKVDRSADVMAAYDEAAVLAAGFTGEATRGEILFDAPLTGGIITAEAKVKTGDLGGNKQFQVFGDGTNAEGLEGEVALATFALSKKNLQAGAVAGGKATKIGDVVENEWINVKVVIDIAKNNVDYYINGEQKHSQPIQNTVTNCKGIRANIAAKQSGTLFVDDIKVTAN